MPFGLLSVRLSASPPTCQIPYDWVADSNLSGKLPFKGGGHLVMNLAVRLPLKPFLGGPRACCGSHFIATRAPTYAEIIRS